MLFVLILLMSNASVVRAQGLQYIDIEDKIVQRPSIYDVYLLHPIGSIPSDYLIQEYNPDHADTSNFRLWIKPMYNSSEVLCSNDTLVKALKSGDPIDETSTIWNSHGQDWMYLANVEKPNSIGEWVNVTHKFVGLRMYKNGDYFYGYVQLSVVPTGIGKPDVTIWDMAYQKTANKGLKAGQTVGVNHLFSTQQNYILNGHQLYILTDKAEKISILDMSGHQLLNADAKSNRSFDLSAFANGIYLLKISAEAGTITKKIVLQ